MPMARTTPPPTPPDDEPGRRRLCRAAAEALRAGDPKPVQRWFRAMAMPEPRTIRNPSRDQVEPERNKRLFSYWQSLPREPDLPHYRRIDPLDMTGLLGGLAIAEILDEGLDARFRLYGTDIVAVSGIDNTGRRVSEMAANAGVNAYLTMFMVTVNLCVIADRAPWYSEHQPPAHISQFYWQRLALPLVDDTGRIARMLLGILPSDRSGWLPRERSASPV